MSGQHLRIYSVCYDEDDASVEPLVYAQNLSSNVALWSHQHGVQKPWYKIRKGQAILLSEGDAIKVSHERYFVFRSCNHSFDYAYELDPIEKVEQRVLGPPLASGSC